MNLETRTRKHIRLREHDYRDGLYFVTICTRNRLAYFGNILEGNLIPSEIGEWAAYFWEEIPKHFPHVELDEYVVMPNHFHGIIQLDLNYLGSHDNSGTYTTNKFGPLPKGSLSIVISQFKSTVTRTCRKNGYDDFGWQSKFHDRLIRNEGELDRIRDYIYQNPHNWNEDDYFL